MCPCLPHWQQASSEIDCERPPAFATSAWRYWFPEARSVVGPDNAERLRRYIGNWIRVRDTWLYLLTNHTTSTAAVRALTGQEWREYLNASPQTNTQIRNGKKGKTLNTKRAVKDLFHAIFQQDIMDCPVPTTWLGRSMAPVLDTNAPLNTSDFQHTARLIAWELHELAFRYELIELDRHLAPAVPDDLVSTGERKKLIAQVFPANRGLVMKVLPAHDDGLAATERSVRAPYVEALRQVVLRWPRVPQTLLNSGDLAVVADGAFQEMEKELARFYCQSFFDVCGRAPVIPRRLPAQTA